MSFWISENKKISHAKVHRAKCTCCNGGAGPMGDLSGCWHGPFSTYSDALAAANKLRRHVDSCKRCKPQL